MHPVEQHYITRTPGSAELQLEANRVFPSGVTHDSRYLKPHGLFIRNASGATKLDVDGNRYIDYFGGHGAMILGHGHPAVLAAVHKAMDGGTHFAAGHETEVRWAEKIIEMVPSAERVRFTSSGTEATQMAVRLSRAFTGRNLLVRFRRHFHGWMDDMTAGYQSHFDSGAPAGVPVDVAGNNLLLDQDDLPGLEQAFAQHGDRIAAVLIEPLGASTGKLPLSAGFLAILQDLTRASGAVLIFDEVITGFRVSDGGVQQSSGITPDLTALAKIVAGSLPGGAVCGREEIMAGLDFARSRALGREKIYHPGTFNANPVSAAAGLATLEVIQREDACNKAAQYAGKLRHALNQLLSDRGMGWAFYGESSVLHLYMNSAGLSINPLQFDATALTQAQLLSNDAEQIRLLRLAMMCHGVDLSGWPGGLCSAAHETAHLTHTVEAFDQALSQLSL